MTPEGKVKAKVKIALKSLPYSYYHMPVMNGMGAPALDFYCCIAGRFVAIETKAPGKPLTPRQEATKNQIEAAGGMVFVIRDDDDIKRMMDVLGKVRLGKAPGRAWCGVVRSRKVRPGGVW